ncbi:SusC/RagA family TonB-linked outer membrane protein [Algoriphagus halophytocola]|uniref:SusC/RagA family TonB-linked outer membrane protein n=1 Tax=Algoriphagus halophytocola TaxID=2991499 RepID=A0ABY6MLN7_9BACT|nr:MULTISPECIES: SusC/RagA family TonB-linked outer membrane protein [unclassified Algoriphagus]UZD24055.1 SusC/RagA family TonB-linked outer membrane protein [Algoriphagus sp. TR-M5]WBL41427.1 SusC/RagA family TonB-linked outer membrane protein [Algoriphagus sp. TR-M9]
MRKLLPIAFTLVLIFGLAAIAQAQNRVLRGTVTSSSDGLPMPGVTILDKSNQTGTTTDVDGQFSLSVSSSSVLVFSFIGYAPQEIAVGDKTELNVVLDEDASELSEVVVTALGISKEKETLGYSVTEVGSESLTQARETNVANSLAGRVAGLVVKGTNSGPGGTSKITLRGLPSISGTGSPLYVINGIPMDNTQRGSAGQWGGADSGDGIGNLSPDDIETMTVLKGQAASALYGSRASNGVILITTKKGAKGGDWSLNYTMNYMVEDPVDFTDFQQVYGQGTGGAKPATATDAQSTGRLAWGAMMDGSSVIGFDGNQYPYSPTSDGYINFYRTGTNFTNTVSLSKGLGEDGSFRMSVSNLDAKSIVPSSGVDRLTINLNVEQNITDKLSVTAMINYIDQKSTNVPNLSDGPKNPNNFLLLAPNISQGIFAPGFDPETGAETVFSDDIYVTNPYFIVNQGINDLGRKRTISAISTKYNFTDDIYAMVRLGNDASNDDFFSVDPYGLAYTGDLKGNLNSRGQSQRSETNIDGILGATFDLNEKWNLDALAGVNMRNNKFETVGVGGSRFVLPYLYSPFNVETFSRSYDYDEREVHSGYYSLGIGYNSILTLTTTGRYDVYSTLPTDNNSIFSPSVAAAFVFDQLIDMPALDFGKLRASYAVTSGEPFDAYQSTFYYTSANSYNGVPAGSSPTALPNLNLKPFTTSEIEFGLDLSFFNNRLAFDVAYYQKETHNEIMNANLSITSGFNSSVVATGSTSNKGLEVLVTGTPVQTPNFMWRSSFNMSSVKNKILSTDPNNNPINLGQNRGTLGNAVTAFVVGEAGPQIRAYDYAYNEDGTIQVDEAGLPVRGELINMGTVLPTLYGGWNNEFNYKGIALSFLIDYNFGNKVLSATEFYSIFRGLNQVTLEGREGGVTNDGVTAPAEEYYRALAQNVTSTSVVDGDFIKLRQLTLGYSFPEKWFGNTPVLKGLDVSFVARNLAILMRKADNIDPEASFGSNINYTGIEGGNLPSTRSFGFNLNFKLN